MARATLRLVRRVTRILNEAARLARRPSAVWLALAAGRRRDGSPARYGGSSCLLVRGGLASSRLRRWRMATIALACW